MLCALAAVVVLASGVAVLARSFGTRARGRSPASFFKPAWASVILPAHRIAGGPAILIGAHPPVHRSRRPAHGRAPAVTRQPRGQAVPVGATANFTATAAGVPPPAAQWQRSADAGRTWTNIHGARGVTYSFMAKAGENGDRFRVRLRNKYGVATSSAATLTIASPPRPRAPRITSHSGSETVTNGAAAVFTASASGNPTPTVQWEVSTDGGSSWRQIASASSSSYSFTADVSENDYQYRAVFINSAGSTVTADATLTVTVTAPGHSAPQVSTQPADQSVQSGGAASFTASASGNPTPTVQWEVSTDGGSSWRQIASASSSSYSFTADVSENDYQYRAVFTNSAGSTVTADATLTVTGTGNAPVITTQPANETVAMNADASFSAAASGTPAATVQWQVSGNRGASWNSISTATSTTLAFTATSQQLYEYRAVFSNSAGTATSNPAILTITQQSSNWSGYATTGMGFNTVSGSWTVPTVTCSGPTTYSSQWIGIDGFNSDTVEQDGTEADCISGSPYYGAWYEMYGDGAVNNGYEVPLSASSYAVFPGDSMTASIAVSDSNWTLAISDTTRSWRFSIPITWSGPAQTSAEWIAERPGISGGLASLANFASVTFTGASATETGTSGPISSFPFQPLEMTNGPTVLAAPGPLDPTGQSFGDTWYASS